MFIPSHAPIALFYLKDYTPAIASSGILGDRAEGRAFSHETV
jgi:hypothetical protein